MDVTDGMTKVDSSYGVDRSPGAPDAATQFVDAIRDGLLAGEKLERELCEEYDLPELAETYEEATARMIANRYIAAYAGIKREQDANDAALRAEVAFLRQRTDERNAKLELRADFLRTTLEALARFFTFPAKSKSLTLPYGRVGFKKSRDRVEYVDEKKALTWARIYAPDTVQTETIESLDRARVNALLLAPVKEGEMPTHPVEALLDSGAVTVYRGRDEFYVSPTHGDNERGTT